MTSQGVVCDDSTFVALEDSTIFHVIFTGLEQFQDFLIAHSREIDVINELFIEDVFASDDVVDPLILQIGQ